MIDTNRPILITGVPRSGATFIARIYAMCGAESGVTTKMYENMLLNYACSQVLLPLPNVSNSVNKGVSHEFKKHILSILHNQKMSKSDWFFKSSRLTLSWRYWDAIFPNAKWIIVRRKPTYIVNSCMKTAYMTTMKEQSLLEQIGCETEEEGWHWLVKFYEKEWIKMIHAGLDVTEVFPDRMASGDYSRIRELITESGFTWNHNVIKTMSPYFDNNKKGEQNG